MSARARWPPAFFGAFSSGFESRAFETGAFNLHQIAVIIGLWGVVISAVYMLRAYRGIFFGEPHRDAVAGTDPKFTLRIPVLLLLGALLITGFFPETLLGYIRPSMEALLK